MPRKAGTTYVYEQTRKYDQAKKHNAVKFGYMPGFGFQREASPFGNKAKDQGFKLLYEGIAWSEIQFTSLYSVAKRKRLHGEAFRQ